MLLDFKICQQNNRICLKIMTTQFQFIDNAIIIIIMFGPRFIDLQTTSQRDYISNHSQRTRSNRKHSPNHSDANSNEKHLEIAKFPLNFIKQDYPSDFSQSNPFCPLCGKYIMKTVPFLAYHSSQRRKRYLIHQACIEGKEGLSLNIATVQARLQSIAFLNQARSIALGGKQYYIQLEILHPMGGFSFAKLWTKVKSIGRLIGWDLRNLLDSDCFSPNIVAFPLPDFQIVVSLVQMGERQSKVTKKATISVGRLGGNEVQFIKAFTQQLQITMRIIGNKDQQAKTIEQMNMKYRYPLQTGTPLVELVRVQIKLPADQSDGEQDQDERSNSKITELNSQKSSFREQRSLHNSQALSERSFDKQKVDLQKLISNNKLSDYVRQNTQSRVFQGWLGEASPRQVDQIISSLWDQLPDLITHQYANYMVQKLLGVCTLPQRLKIVQRLQIDIPGIAKNKQGTHSLQTLIALFTNNDEYKLICDSVKPNYLALAQHPNATHFLQKIITLFPLSQTMDFIQIVNADFLAYALDKNAMCVIKQMIKKISELEKNGKGSQATQARRQFVHSVNFNIDKIISDPYGNYVLQFCYQLFGEQRCVAITQRIIDKFTQFSLQKYSSAVVFKCISNYWVDKQTLQKLKKSLTADYIIEMFRNKDANKILLQIMEKHEDSALWQKIQNQLMIGELTKFNHQRWGVALGSRSGIVGTQFNSFSDAVKRSPNKKKKYYNNIH